MSKDEIPKLGATGNYPKGKIIPEDQGELRLAIGTHDDSVIIEFGKEVKWIGLGKEDAIQFANTILQWANKL